MLGLALLSVCSLQAADDPSSARIHLLQVTIKSGPNQKLMRARLYLQVSRREADGSTVGRGIILRTKGYSYLPEDKWGPNEEKTFELMAPEQFTMADLGGVTLVDGMDKLGASELEVESVSIVGTDLSGKKWVIADFHPDVAVQRHWLGEKEESGENPALPISTIVWKPAP